MTYFAQRTCTVINEENSEDQSQGPSEPLTNFADKSAYVLIGEPGAGKTTVFKYEAKSHGGTYVTARNFLALPSKPEWQDTTLYIDGLDETRAGLTDGRTPLDQIRLKLHQLGCPKFRLSCRWADWFGSNDRKHLKDVSGDGQVTVLRLDPLSKQDIKDILHKNFDIEDTDGFIAAARERGIDALLKNPQTLGMLAEAVSVGKWPETRKETFELACRKLLTEVNDEHLIANPQNISLEKLFDTAGRLCAAQLLTGCAGYTLLGKAIPDEDYPTPEKVNSDRDDYVRHVLSTRLFAGSSEGRLVPTHRQISEFLAARYVAGLIDEGLSLDRVLALITGFDGDVLPLSQFSVFIPWLAVHSKSSRKRISQIDPSGMIYIGDSQDYSIDEKRDIVKNLRRESHTNPWCSRSIRRLPGIGKIVTPELEETFREIMSAPDIEHAHQFQVMTLLEMLADGEVLPGLSDLIQQIVRDDTWNPGVKCTALDVLVKQNEKDHLDASILVKILEDIESELIFDPQDELLGIVLKALYPNTLSVAQVLQFLREPKYTSSMGEYSEFWTSHVVESSSRDQLIQFLDAIVERIDDYRPFFVGEIGLYTLLGQLPTLLLSRFLKMSPAENVPVEHLFKWLLVVSDPELRVPESERIGVRVWLMREQEILKRLIAHGVNTCSESENFWECMRLVERRLFGACPWDFATWCLDQALIATDKNAAHYYIDQVAERVFSGQDPAGLTSETVRERISGNTDLLTFFDQKINDLESPAPQATDDQSPESTEDTQDQREWQQKIELQESEIRENRGAPSLLHKVAMAYLGSAENVNGNTPQERLRNLIGSQERLISVLLEGIRKSINRNDLPDCSEILNFWHHNHTHFLALPFMAGLSEIEQTEQFDVTQFSENQMRLAVTIFYTLPHNGLYPDHVARTVLYRPQWFKSILVHHTRLVADVFTQCVQSKLQNGKQIVPELYELATSDDHKEIAQRVALPLLENFPVERTDERLYALGWLLKAALLNCEWSQLIEIIKKKLSSGDVDAMERVYLTAGFVIVPEKYREELKAHVSREKQQQRALQAFMNAGKFPSALIKKFNAEDLKLWIDLMASAASGNGVTENAWIIISNLIRELSSDPSPEATESLEALSSNDNLAPWYPTIVGELHRQTSKRREAEFRHCDIQKVVEVLDNRRPANAADLAALVFDIIEDFSRQIRDGSTSDWRQYWNVDSYNRPINPKPEDACRDALLSDLRGYVGRLGIDAQPEGRYAEDNRADIRVSSGNFNIPVEIKKSCHPDLWTAIKDQLIARYSRDPGAEGYGIYLVFWFGNIEECRPTPGPNLTPQNSEELKFGLLDTLTEGEEPKISVCVIDVSKP